MLYLAPEPDAGLRALTDAVVGRRPEAPPYGGQFADVVPHLTIADGQEPGLLDMIESDVRGRLPVATRITTQVQLIAYAGGYSKEIQSFSLASSD